MSDFDPESLKGHDIPSRLIVVTGPSGAGRSTAINVLEDLGFEVIDNMPLSMLPRLIDGTGLDRPLALGVDVRNRDFSVDALTEALEGLAATAAFQSELLYLDCDTDVLIRRYSETRRRHPLAPEEPPSEGIAREKHLLEGVRDFAEVLIDTSAMTPHDLRAEMSRWFGLGTAQQLSVSLHSFSYKRGVPRGIDMVLDCRFLANPHWQPDLRALDGRREEVAAYVASDPNYAAFFRRVTELVESLLPAYMAEGKAHFALGFGCTGGKHRSVALTEAVAVRLAQAGWQVSKRHRELERGIGAATSQRVGEKA
ncbi:MAG: RNase adapter RapZ [Pseudomonadota bacterium]